MAQSGFLLIADITGYTMFLTRSELEHAQGILDALFKSIFAEIKAPIILSNLQGDAALAYLPDANVPQRQFPLDAMSGSTAAFPTTLGAMRLNTTCSCNACRNMAQLDLKFFLHHGTYATQEMAGRTELQGPEVIRPAPPDEELGDGGLRHQGLRDGDRAGGRGRSACPSSLRPRSATSNPQVNSATPCATSTILAPIFARWRASRRIVVRPDEPLAFEFDGVRSAGTAGAAWAYVTDVGKKIRWQRGLDGMTVTGLAHGRVAQGSTQHCAHGKDSTQHDIIDSRPSTTSPGTSACRSAA